MSVAIDVQKLRPAHTLLLEWSKQFVVVGNRCHEIDEEDHRPPLQLGPHVARFMHVIQHLRDSVELLLKTPLDHSARTMVVFDLEKLATLGEDAPLQAFLHPQGKDDTQHSTTNFWLGGTLYNILGILADIRRAMHMPATDRQSAVHKHPMARSEMTRSDVGLRQLLVKLQAAS